MALSCVPPKTFALAYLNKPIDASWKASPAFIQVCTPKSVVFKQYQSTFDDLYPNIDTFKEQFATATESIVTSNRHSLEKQFKVNIEEIYFGSESKQGFFLPIPPTIPALFFIDFSKDYCLIRITFEISDSKDKVLFSGVLVTASSDGHAIFSRKKRVAAAISHAEEKFADLILGKLPTAETMELTTPKSK